jgi:hypothetical protein
MDNKETIVKFLTAMSTQDNRATAFPIYYVIRTAEWMITDEDYGCGDGGDSGSCQRIRYVCNDCHEEVISEEEFNKLPETEEDLTDEQRDSEDQADQMTQEDYTRHCEARIWREKGLFLTDTDAKEHLRRNSYHYSKDAHTYVHHVWRAPELEEFLLALFSYFDVPPRKDPGTM